MTQTPSTTGTTNYAGQKFPFDIYVTPECLVKMNEYGRAAQPTEIGGLARLEINKETKNIFVTDIHVFPQRTEAAYFEISDTAMQEWTLKMVKEGRGDELAEWKSIFHTHPVGMAPSMSGHDVDQIKSFAQEGDAFSFILSASNTAESVRMNMHYCCNFYGEKFIIRDIPVKHSLSADRLTLSDQVTKYLFNKLGGKEALNEQDVTKLDGLVTKFLSETVPIYFTEGRKVLRAEIEAHTEAMIERTPRALPAGSKTGYTPVVGDYAAGHHRGWMGSTVDDDDKDSALDNDAMNAMLKDAVARGEISEHEASEYSTWLTADEQVYVGYTNTGVKDTFQRELEVIHHLYALAFEKTDSENPNRPVSNKRAKKAARMWKLRVLGLNDKLRKETEEKLGLYDLVIVDYSKISSNKDNKSNSELATVPTPIESFIHDQTGFSFEVGGELFWSHELIQVKTFDKKMEEVEEEQQMKRQLARAEAQQSVDSKKLEEASDDLEAALNL